MFGGVLRLTVLALLVGGAACEYVDRARAPAAEESPGSGLALSLESPGSIRIGEEVTVRLSLTNRGDSVAHGVRAELLIPEWMEPVLPEPSGREVTMVSTPDEGTRLSYRIDDPPLQPGETQSITQRIRAPLAAAAGGEAMPWGRMVRARLVTMAGEPIGAEVESEMVIDTTGLGELRGSDTLPAAGEGARVQRDRVGPLRPGMTAAAVRQAAPGVRDTTWSLEGMQERGLVVPLPGGGRAVALLAGDSVERIHVAEREPRTAEGLGVGSRLEELRAAYGRACAGIGEGRVVVWFAAAPEISFALDTPVTDAAQIEREPDRIPGSATVRELWVRRDAAPCR